MNPLQKQNFLNVIALVGIFVFIFLYIYASTLYPGGNQSDWNAVGFNWQHNYWCDLMNTLAENDAVNPASPYAIAAIIVLCLSVLVFFIQFAKYFARKILWKRIIQIGGALAMICTILIFTKYHNTMIFVSSLFGLAVILAIVKVLYQTNLNFFKLAGLFCIFLLALNNYIYYTKQGIEVLPLLQKITFGIVLLWIAGLTLKMIQKSTIEKGEEVVKD